MRWREGRGRGEVQAHPGAGRRAGRGPGCRAGGRGVADQCWTLARIADQVWRRFGVEYTLAGMDVLLHRLGWSVQVPARRAAERDEEKIARWREDTWPVIKRGRGPGRLALLGDESGQGLRPPKARTWGRRGRTPVVKVTGGHDTRVSLAALIAARPGQPAPADLPHAPCPAGR